MLAALRRSRLLAALLVIASPAMGGTLLTAIHPCPVDTPWLAHHQDGAKAGHHGNHGTPAGTKESQTCHCIGNWLTGGAITPPLPVLAVAPVRPPIPVLLPAHDSSLQLAPPSALLPPATAPPLV